MRILSIHNEYLIKGGEDESRRLEAEIFEQNGHEVTYYTESNTKIETMSKLQAGLRTLWSKESYRNIRKILIDKPYDIVHVQNYFPIISPSVYYSAKSCGVPVIQAVRNYRLMCPAGTFYRNQNVCEDCLGKMIPLVGIKHRCYRNNQAATATVVAMLGMHNLFNSWRYVDKFIAVSDFVKNKLMTSGFSEDKIAVKPNFVFPDPGVDYEKEDYFVYVGRLQEEKGIGLLLQALSMIKDQKIKVKVIGDGPLLDEVLGHANRYQNVEYMGRLNLRETYQIIGRAKALIVPSLWHEPFGRVVVEAYAKGTPVIGANRGGISELIINTKTGLLFDPSSVDDLVEKIQWMNTNETTTMERNSRVEFENKYTAQANYSQLLNIYNEVIS